MRTKKGTKKHKAKEVLKDDLWLLGKNEDWVEFSDKQGLREVANTILNSLDLNNLLKEGKIPKEEDYFSNL